MAFFPRIYKRIRELLDIDYSTPPQDGQALVYDAEQSKWKAGTIEGGGTVTNPLNGSDGFPSVDFEAYKLFIDQGNVATVEWQNMLLNAESWVDNSWEASKSIDWNNRYLYASDGTTIVATWSDGTLRDGNGNPIGGTVTSPLNDINGSPSVDFYNRLLKAPVTEENPYPDSFQARPYMSGYTPYPMCFNWDGNVQGEYFTGTGQSSGPYTGDQGSTVNDWSDVSDTAYNVLYGDGFVYENFTCDQSGNCIGDNGTTGSWSEFQAEAINVSFGTIDQSTTMLQWDNNGLTVPISGGYADYRLPFTVDRNNQVTIASLTLCGTTDPNSAILTASSDGNLLVNGTPIAGGNPFDQSLNTSDSVEFNSIAINNNDESQADLACLYEQNPLNGFLHSVLTITPSYLDETGSVRIVGDLEVNNTFIVGTGGRQVVGAMRFDTPTSSFQGYNGSDWVSLGGGSVLYDGGHNVSVSGDGFYLYDSQSGLSVDWANRILYDVYGNQVIDYSTRLLQYAELVQNNYPDSFDCENPLVPTPYPVEFTLWNENENANEYFYGSGYSPEYVGELGTNATWGDVESSAQNIMWGFTTEHFVCDQTGNCTGDLGTTGTWGDLESQAFNVSYSENWVTTSVATWADGTLRDVNGDAYITTGTELSNISTQTITATDDLTITCGTDHTLKLNAPVWKDTFFPMGSVKTTGTGNPTLTNIFDNFRLYTFAVNDIHDFDPQEYPHDGVVGGSCSWHIHFISRTNVNATRGIKWELEFSQVAIDGTFPAKSTKTVDFTIPANTPANTHFLVAIGTNFTALAPGSMMLCRLKRIASADTAPAADPAVLGVHYHYQVDTLGSRTMTAK